MLAISNCVICLVTVTAHYNYSKTISGGKHLGDEAMATAAATFHCHITPHHDACVYDSLAEDIEQHLGHLKESWGFPKFSNMRDFPDDIRQYGMTDNYTSAPGERFNKHIKAAARRTNFNPRTLAKQVKQAY